MWIFFRLKSQRGGRTAYASAMMKLIDYPNNKKEVHDLWDAEVVYLAPGDFVYARSILRMTISYANIHTGFSPLDRFMGLTLR
jgi:hypothetical protein